jgi:ABC-2 type transport system ATP-binding protein
MHGPIDDVYRRIRGNRTVEVRFMNGMDVGLSVIRSSPHVRNVAIDVNSCVVELEANDQQVNELLQQLIHNKCGVRSFSEKEPSLEDVFMMVTKGLVS